MNPPDYSLRARITPAQWDELRLAFHRSVMIETSLSSLAQNIDGCVWDLGGADEKPSAYIDFTHAEAVTLFRARGQPAARLDDLADILRGTLAFDESFGEMATIAGKAEAASDPILRNLKKLGIPADFPIRFCFFTPGIRNFCASEAILTLGDFLGFSRHASRRVIVGAEFRDLLNAVSHIDELTLARYLPFRPKASGLHLVEALAHLVRPLSIEERLQLARGSATLPATLQTEANALFDYFAPQAEHLRARLADGSPVARLVVSLDDLSLESAVAALLAARLSPAPVAAAPATPSWWRRLLKRGG